MPTQIQDALSAAGFNAMPFRIVPPTDMDSVQWAGDRTTIDAFHEAARAPRADFLGTSELVVLFGEFGSGKTNALKWLTKQMRSEGQLVAYLVRPSVADKPMWHDIVRSLFTYSFKREDVIDRLGPLRTFVLVESGRLAREELGAKADGDPDALRKSERDWRRKVATQVVPDHPGFVDFVVDLCAPDRSLSGRNWSYLSDEPSKSDGKAIADSYGLPAEGLGSDWSASVLLSSLILALTYQTPNGIGSDVVCIFMDEVEGFYELPTGSRLSILQGIRELFNACTEHLCIALAATASDASEMWGILDTSLMHRLSRQPIQFAHLEPEAAKAFMLEMMALYRSADYSGSAEWPFSDDGLDAFIQACPQPLTPRKLLVSAQRLCFKPRSERS